MSWSLVGDGDETPLPPGTPPTRKFEGPWFQTQLYISTALGLLSFLVFSYLRTRWTVLFAPRTKLKGFSPHEAHAHQAFFGWILPTIRTSEFTILQIVGLDAAVLLNFFKMSFSLFATMSLFAAAILMPVNYRNNLDSEPDEDSDPWVRAFRRVGRPRPRLGDPSPPDSPGGGGKLPSSGRDWLDLLNDANSYLSLQLFFTYLFTFLALRFIYKNYTRFIRARQLFSLELVHSIAARTVIITDLPNHLRGERALAVYFENMGMSVESVNCCRDVGALKALLDKRTEALLKLESAWVRYLGNPSTVMAYDPLDPPLPPLVDIEDQSYQSQSQQQQQQSGRLVVPNRKRPTIRPGWFKGRVDEIDYLEARFKEADEAVRKKRRSGKLKSSDVAFVTFEKMSSAQIATQAVLAPQHTTCTTQLAPEPRDIVWSNMTLTRNARRIREFFVISIMWVLLFFWIFPIAALASLLSYKEITAAMPWLGRMIDSSERIRAVVQNLLPSVAVIGLNALLPFFLEGLTYFQGYRARSWIEYSLLRKYFLFLLINVVFIFLLASTYWQLIRELAESPGKIPEKLALALQQGKARHFFLSYIILQGVGLMPMQLLNLGVIIPRIFYRVFLTRTPRDFAELNAPPMINYGAVYPQAILIFVITMLYSVIQPAILIFGALYFGIGYVVYKYKLLFVFYKPYESQGQAWPITFVRLIWGVVIFQILMTGIFLLKKAILLAMCMIPLIAGTIIWAWWMYGAFMPLSKFVNLSATFEVQRGEESDEVARMRMGHPVTWSQSNLSRRRYAQNDDTLYVAPEDERTDYSQPPMTNWYNGVLNTGKRRYGHPVLTGVLPQPWLPLKKGQTLVNNENGGNMGVGVKKSKGEAVVLTLRKRYTSKPKTRDASVLRHADSVNGGLNGSGGGKSATSPTMDDSLMNPWDTDSQPGSSSRSRPRRSSRAPLHHKLSFDGATGVINLPEDDWLMEVDVSDSEADEDDGDESMAGSGVLTPGEGLSQDEGLLVGAGAGAGAGVGVGVGDEVRRDLSLTLDTSRGLASTSAAGSGALNIVSPSKRHSTYYHHPEKRRTLPGAFPRS